VAIRAKPLISDSSFSVIASVKKNPNSPAETAHKNPSKRRFHSGNPFGPKQKAPSKNKRVIPPNIQDANSWDPIAINISASPSKKVIVPSPIVRQIKQPVPLGS